MVPTYLIPNSPKIVLAFERNFKIFTLFCRLILALIGIYTNRKEAMIRDPIFGFFCYFYVTLFLRWVSLGPLWSWL
jgi:hypothetical protein